ncbi:MAG TPA: response regulator transcription factor, partial [Burkholderiaceae bacterium]
ETAAAARAALGEQSDFKLVLLDLQLDDENGYVLLDECRRLYPLVPVVALSASDHSEDVLRAIELGAMGYVPKRTRTETLLNALKLVLSGAIYVPAMRMDRPPSTPIHAPGSTAISANGLDGLKLTPRQLHVLDLLLQGLPNKLIARQLDISVETVKDHVAAVLKALGVTSRTQAVLAVSQMKGASAL